MKKQGFTLIELLAVIIILAVIALIATPIVLNVVEKAKESSRKSSVAGYADATRIAILEYQFQYNGKLPILDKDFISAIKPQGNKVTCEEIYNSSNHGIVLHNCNVEDNEKKYCFASGKDYNCSDKDYTEILEIAKSGDANPGTTVSDVSNDCAKNGNTCTLDQIKVGVSMNVEVGPGEIYKFYILSDNGTELTLLMDTNLDTNNDKEITYDDNVEWKIAGKASDGPATILSLLKSTTDRWVNIPKRVYNLIGTSNDTYNFCNSYSECTTNIYTDEKFNLNERARLPRNQELSAVGCASDIGTCPAWVHANLDGSYWTSTASGGSNPYHDYAWIITRGGYFASFGSDSNDDVIHGIVPGAIGYASSGIRPVITIFKSNIK